jgi:putative DNA primase/helicase
MPWVFYPSISDSTTYPQSLQAVRSNTGMMPEQVEAAWQDQVKYWPRADQEQARPWVQQKTGQGLRQLSQQLSALRQSQQQEAKQAQAVDFAEQRAREGRPVVIWSEDRFNAVLAEARLRLLATADQGELYCYAGQLVSIAPAYPVSISQLVLAHEAGEQAASLRVIRSFTPTTLAARVQQCLTFMDHSKKEPQPVGCPPRLAQHLLDEPSFARPLAGLLASPTVRPDGTLLNQPQYDPVSGLLGVFQASLGHAIPDPARISRRAAEEALSFLLEEVLADFPFASALDQAAALAALLTAFTRLFLPSAPGFMISAATQASGKSTLADVLFFAAFGRTAAAASWSDNQDEMRKVLVGVLLQGQVGLCFDNLPFGCRVDGDELAKLLTQEEYEARLLGSNRLLKAGTPVFVCLTGNQITAVNDMASRLLPIRLNPQLEDPTQRTFRRHNITTWLAHHRPQIIAAVCTLLLAWHRVGKQEMALPRGGRFAQWSDSIRAPLLWLGLPDINRLFDENQGEDQDRIADLAFLEAWHRCFANAWLDLKTILSHWPDSLERGSELGQALADRFAFKRPTTQQLGASLRTLKGAVLDDYQLEQQASNSKSKRARPWRVQSRQPPCTTRLPATETSIIATDASRQLPTPREGGMGFKGFSMTQVDRKNPIFKTENREK